MTNPGINILSHGIAWFTLRVSHTTSQVTELLNVAPDYFQFFFMRSVVKKWIYNNLVCYNPYCLKPLPTNKCLFAPQPMWFQETVKRSVLGMFHCSISETTRCYLAAVKTFNVTVRKILHPLVNFMVISATSLSVCMGD